MVVMVKFRLANRKRKAKSRVRNRLTVFMSRELRPFVRNYAETHNLFQEEAIDELIMIGLQAVEQNKIETDEES